MFVIRDELKILPDKPGVYLMKDKHENIIYVGKAISLKRRVRQYFSASGNHSPKVLRLVENIVSFEYIVTDNEMEALILECNLIKRYKPRYNVLLKDDKTYPYIKITAQETYPRVYTTRKVLKDGAKYFGPFTNVYALNNTMDTIKKLFPIRDCTKTFGENATLRPCLNYHIGKCSGPCAGYISAADYRVYIDDIIDLLNGKTADLIKKLNRTMQEHSDKLEFEKAVVIREKIDSLKIISEKQKVVSVDGKDRDVIGYAANSETVCIEIFFIRSGNLLGRQHYFLDNHQESESLIVGEFIKRYYPDVPYLPPEILVMGEIDEKDLICDMLYRLKGKRVKILLPQKGEKSSLLKMVRTNAEITLKNNFERLSQEREKALEGLRELAQVMGLADVPRRIEAFDISNTGADDKVAGMVVFKEGLPFKEGYRKYKIKSVEGQDDFASMAEVLSRRIRRILKDGLEQPDLILVDGGISHVNVATGVMEELGVDLPVLGMAKDDRHRTRALVQRDGTVVDITQNPVLLRCIALIQEEVHRFAITYNRQSGGARIKKSVLDSVPGIGPKKKKALIQHFGSIAKIREASLEELTKVEGMDAKTVKVLMETLAKGDD